MGTGSVNPGSSRRSVCSPKARHTFDNAFGGGQCELNQNSLEFHADVAVARRPGIVLDIGFPDRFGSRPGPEPGKWRNRVEKVGGEGWERWMGKGGLGKVDGEG